MSKTLAIYLAENARIWRHTVLECMCTSCNITTTNTNNNYYYYYYYYYNNNNNNNTTTTTINYAFNAWTVHEPTHPLRRELQLDASPLPRSDGVLPLLP